VEDDQSPRERSKNGERKKKGKKERKTAEILPERSAFPGAGREVKKEGEKKEKKKKTFGARPRKAL